MRRPSIIVQSRENLVECAHACRYTKRYSYARSALEMGGVAAAYQAALTAGIGRALLKVSRCCSSVRDSSLATLKTAFLEHGVYGVLGTVAMPSVCVDSLQQACICRTVK
jgi:hypothetical protein